MTSVRENHLANLISDEYLHLQKELHTNPNYGNASLHFGELVLEIAGNIGAKSISDYGAGKRRLYNKLLELGKKNFAYFAYDPAFPEYGPPLSADLVCCIDVLEHIEPIFLDPVLEELTTITKNVGFFTIHTGPAVKFLSDGRNAHLIQEPCSWWLRKICEYFEVVHLQKSSGGFWVILEPLITRARHC